jgi:pimeloyl-ACP methyl ester carboxylesterase
LRTIALTGLLIALAAAACTLAQEPSLVRLPDGRRINLECAGRGAPTVLLESGFGATAGAWSKVQPVLARKTRVCAYDRAGYGFSDPGPLPRDGAAIARDLDAVLRAAGIDGPFVVVGHSAGGLYVRIFDALRPADVVGMVLVDPSVDHQDKQFSMFGRGAASLEAPEAAIQRCLDLAQAGSHTAPDAQTGRCYDAAGKLLPAGLWRTELSELQTLWGPTSDEVVSGRTFYGDLPLIVLTASGTYKSGPGPARQAVSARWEDLHRAIAALSTRGEHRLVERSSHLIMIDRPDAVIQAVEDVIKQAEARKAP